MFGELESLEKKPPMPTVTLSDQMASALDMVGSGGGEEVAEQTAAEQLLEYRDRNKHDLDDFVPLTAKAGEPSTAGGKFLLGQLGGTAVAAPTYWKSAECQMGRKSFKKDRLVLKPGAKKAAKKVRKGSEYMDRLKAKATKQVALQKARGRRT